MASNTACFLGFAIPKEMADDLFAADSLPAVQTHKFGWSFVRAMNTSFDKLLLVSACPIQSFPLGKKILFRGKNFAEGEIKGRIIGFVNIVVLKHLTRLFSCLLLFPRLVFKERIDFLFIHGVHSPFLLFGLLVRLFRVKVIVVMTDPPGVVLPTDGMLAKLMKRVDAGFIRFLLRYISGAVALAPSLVDLVGKKKPVLVFPGIVSADLVEDDMFKKAAPFRSRQVGTPLKIIYAGGLYRAYGVDLLLDAMKLLADAPVRLELYGWGELEDEIKALSIMDSRIVYGGCLRSDQMKEKLLQADLLINPRPPDMGAAAMSFPSKLIEYLAVGRPVLTTRIGSIPESWNPYFLFIETPTAEGVSSAISRVLSLDPEWLKSFACVAQEFVLGEASEISVGKKISKFVEKIT